MSDHMEQKVTFGISEEVTAPIEAWYDRAADQNIMRMMGVEYTLPAHLLWKKMKLVTKGMGIDHNDIDGTVFRDVFVSTMMAFGVRRTKYAKYVREARQFASTLP